MLLARPLRCRMASKAASLSNGSLFREISPNTCDWAAEGAWAIVDGVIGLSEGLTAGVIGEKWIGIVVVVVIVRVIYGPGVEGSQG